MKTYTYNRPFNESEKKYALNLLKTETPEFVAHRYHCSTRSLRRWKKQFDGSVESLKNKSHTPHTPNKNRHTDEEKKHILAIIKRNPGIGLNELYSKLRLKYAYCRNPTSLYRYLRKNGFYDQVKKKVREKPKKYDTPQNIGVKMQLDVKVVPYECRTKKVPFDKKFYQYTIIDEATRERFLYAYDEQTAKNTVDFVKRAIVYFGYTPKMIQTDNGQEFTYIRSTSDDKVHPFDELCVQLNIEHKLIKPRTPKHNGKVERSHRNDEERFYSWLKFYSLDDLNKQLKAYVKRSNNICTRALKSTIDGKVVWLTPLEMREKLLKQLNL